MNKIIIFFLASILFFFTACSTQKKIAETSEKDNTTTSEDGFASEQKKIEFEYLFIEGLKQKMIGSPDNAIQYFNSCLDIMPNSAAVLYELANIHYIKNDFTSAKLLLERAIDINPENKWYKLLLAQILQNNQQYLEASKIYRELIKTEPDNINFYYLNALLLSSGGQYDEAIKAYNQLEEKTGFNEQISMARQQLYRQAGKDKEAYKEIEKLIEHDPTVPEYYGLLADMYKEDGEMNKALEYYNKVLEIEPGNGFVHFSLATFYIQNKEPEKAFTHAKQGFHNPDIEIETKIQLYLMLATAPKEQNFSDEEILELVDIISQVHPDDPRSYSIKADYFIQRNRLSEAKDYLEKALDVDPNSYPLWEQLIILDNQTGDYESMGKHSKKTMELFPTQPLPYVLNAVANIQLEAYEKALDALEAGQTYLVDNKKLEAQFELYRAEAYYNLNKRSEAFEAFEKVIEIEPDNYMAMNNYAYYLSLKGEKLDRAEMLSSEVVKANPNNPTYLDTHAWVLFKKQEFRLAKFYMETAMKNGGNESAVVVEHYGDILYNLGETEKAIKNWEKSAEMGNESKTLQQKIFEKRYIEGEE
ncbi:MAG: tetratricopeptide repeat protein [Prolixibacteraceae bacterium]|nr:tetratricopeptide repeat protein [Prolixibacteraceae bacterium]